MGGRFCIIDRTLVKIRGVARILQRERLFWKFDPILFDLQKKGLRLNSNAFSGRNHKFKGFFRPKTCNLQKKGLRRISNAFSAGRNLKFKSFFWLKTQKKKRSSLAVEQFFSASLFPRNLVLYLTGLWASFSSHLSSLKSRWGTLNLDEGTFNLDRGRVPPSSLQFKYCFFRT